MEIRLLGVVEASVDGTRVPLGAAKPRAVLAMLALEANAPVSTDRLIAGLWGERPPASATKLVQLYVSQLRKLLPGIVTRGRGYELRVPEDAVDALRFERLIAEDVHAALGLWRGPPLDDLADHPFAAAEIRRLEELRLRARELAVDAALATGEHAAVVAELQELVQAHPLREGLRRQLMLALYRSGRQAEALAAYTDARRALVEDLGIEPGRDLRELHQAILVQQPALEALPVEPLPPAAHNLPHELSSFIGRERELDELRSALTTTRLLTLTGPGGAGKTRLALRAAWELVDAFPGGVWWVELAPLADERLVGGALAEALTVRPLPGMTELQAACAYLAPRRALVILDNCEHLPAATAAVADTLLRSAGEVVALATSRAPLGVEGETDWRVPPLSLPADEREGSDAVSLFVERARQVRPGFALHASNAESVTSVCRDLDGLPLALELAAARMRMLSADQIAVALADRFRLLTGGPRTATQRQQTLRGSVDWSHDLLAADARVLLRRVAVFAGGFTLEAAEAVCAGDGIERDELLDVLASLVDQSLVIAEERDAGIRYRLLETVRQYGLERLTAAGEEVALRDRHRDFFLALAEAPSLGAAWIQRLDPEAANAATALDHALRGDVTLALRLAIGLFRWWWARGRLVEAELAYARVVEACGEREPALRARLLHCRAEVAITSGDNAAAVTYATEALALAEAVGDEQAASRALLSLGLAAQFSDPVAGRANFARAAALARAADDGWCLVTAGQGTALTFTYQSDHAESTRANDEVAALAEQLGDPFQVARRWFYAAWPAVVDGRFAQAREWLERMRAAVAVAGDPTVDAFAEICVANIEIQTGAPERALERLQPALERSLKLGARIVLPNLITSMAYAELAAGRFAAARDRLQGLLPLVEGRDAYSTMWSLCLLADVQRLQGDEAAEATAVRAQASAEGIGNRLFATRARLTLGRLAAARGEWTEARPHVQAHLDACLEGGHALDVPAALDALAEIAAGFGEDRDAVRLFADAERARSELGVVRVPAEAAHWARTAMSF